MKHVRETGGRHRGETKPRYGRISILGASLTVTAIAVAGGFGLLPNGADRSAAASSLTSGESRTATATDKNTAQAPESGATDEPSEQSSEQSSTSEPPVTDGTTEPPETAEPTAPPAGSGKGKRVVFSEDQQRVWLVNAANDVLRTYLVSGSVYDNLDPGTYAVYSRSRNAIGIDDSGTMEYFVRFTQGDEGAAIGFHTIPVDDGEPVQTLKELGTPLSHGCIRQKRANAIALWDFAPIGTTVVVTV